MASLFRGIKRKDNSGLLLAGQEDLLLTRKPVCILIVFWRCACSNRGRRRQIRGLSAADESAFLMRQMRSLGKEKKKKCCS